VEAKPRRRDLLRFITCGSTEDGKSTLVESLLSESGRLFEHNTMAPEFVNRGTRGEATDFGRFVHRFHQNREQGITNDVPYRFFSTARREFIVTDTPGHEQYTRAMAAGASNAQVAVILIDARKGLLTQTMRHTRIAHMLGIKDVVVAINKMDLVHWAANIYVQIERDYLSFVKELRLRHIQFIPISAVHGDNIVEMSANSPWYGGATLLRFLEEIEVPGHDGSAFRMPVQSVSRASLTSSGFYGRIAAGAVRPGDRVRTVPSGFETKVRSIVAEDGELGEAGVGCSVTVSLEHDVDVAIGDVIAAATAPPEAADQFEARLLWMHPHALIAGRVYTANLHTKQVAATVTEIKYRIDVNSGAHLAAKSIGMNQIAVVNVSFDHVAAFEPYDVNRTLGSFVLIDCLTKEAVGAGIIDFALRRAANVHWQAVEVNQNARAALMQQRPRCFWFTGLPASGKSTIANLVEKRLLAAGRHTYLLDGDNVRHGLNRDLGFTEADRVENIRRVAEVARLMVDAGLIVLVSFISPYRAERRFARALFRPGQFVEVFIDTPLQVCEQRDPKGLYSKARAGQIKNFTGLDSPYEPPENSEILINTTEISAAEAAEQLLEQSMKEW
jgi:bifunctional enzyme CysN/CysC